VFEMVKLAGAGDIPFTTSMKPSQIVDITLFPEQANEIPKGSPT
jgi:hypothetical protein